MCRLLGVVSAEPAPLTEILTDELEPFSRLASVHCDGWGLAAWTPAGDLDLHRQTTAALVEPGLIDVCERTTTDAALMHLRKASAGMAVSTENTHPFSAGSIAFAHNGFFQLNPEVDKLLEGLNAVPPVGETDSERYFSLVLALMRTNDPASAMLRAATMIGELAEVEALNTMMLTHQALYAFAFYDEKAVPADPEAHSYELRFRVSERAVLVASSGWEQPLPTWEPLVSGTVLEIRRSDLRVSIHRLAASCYR
ncbi:class II glutamine amidotransferase [Amycolatopsis sp. H20-H5]|uniref:class II glutamine amidotransferase n=1 Tax=Amycolatopsis sp. H20-H5 TaxID=3046309 RepID=UPI002DBED788|nr:class II glutamine amidotransferase [Amycolatopsis sp. H20-H5]MEC3976610.1 class II glutamine amidotransferase [Amycolatopsis sp. H20-H5]